MPTRSLTRRDLLSAARPITLSHSISIFIYAQHLVAREKRFFEDEGVTADQGSA